MRSDPEVVALIPMRHESERIPGKNLRRFVGKPLFHRIIETLLASDKISRIVIDTDSDEIASDVEGNFRRIEIISRPHHLLGGETPMNAILLHDVGLVEADLYLQTHSTNPLLRTSTIDAALKAFLDQSRYDSLFAVTRLQTRLWDSHSRPINHDLDELRRTQDLEPVFEENSNIYIFTKESLQATGNRIGRKPMMFEIDRDEAWDIDEEVDLRIAECLYRIRENG